MPDIVLPGRLPHGLALAEVTGDGNIDIITALSDGMGVFPGNGNLTFGAPIISTTAPFKFKMADFNRRRFARCGDDHCSRIPSARTRLGRLWGMVTEPFKR